MTNAINAKSNPMDITAQRDPNNIYHPMAVAELAGLAPYINWPEFCERTGTPPVSELNVRVSN